MRVDAYTKLVLTVIAVSLAAIATKGLPPVGTAQAQQDAGIRPNVPPQEMNVWIAGWIDEDRDRVPVAPHGLPTQVKAR